MLSGKAFKAFRRSGRSQSFELRLNDREFLHTKYLHIVYR